MKKAILSLFICLNLFSVNANPLLPPPIISEIYFDTFNEDNWFIELYFDYIYYGMYDNLDGFMLISAHDMTYPNLGIYFEIGDPFVITQDDMQFDFDINRDGDTLTLFDNDGYEIAEISFGDAYVKAPGPAQSIAIDYIWLGLENYLTCKEFPPTLGSDVYNVYARGLVEGYVYDQLNNPVSNSTIEFMLGPYTYRYGDSDENGYFHIGDLMCCNWHPKIYFNDVYIDNFTVAIEPDSTSFVEIYLDTTLTATWEKQAGDKFISLYNYPNPCRSYTVFNCTVPENSIFLTGYVNIYNQNGQQVDRLLFENQPGVNHQIYWHAPDLDDGMYIYTLELDGKVMATNKMTVLR
jgi:hypothetical protein